MKKNKCMLFFLIGLCLGIIGSIIYSKVHPKAVKSSTPSLINYIDKGEINPEDTITFENLDNEGANPDSGFIPNAKVAYEVAIAVLKPIYGHYVDKEKPYKVVLDSKRYWIITGSKDSISKGGVAEVILRKSDGRVIMVTHGK